MKTSIRRKPMTKMSYLFEPGDNLTKLAEEDIEVKNFTEFNHEVNKRLTKYLGQGSRASARLEVKTAFPEHWNKSKSENPAELILTDSGYIKLTDSSARGEIPVALIIPYTFSNGKILPFETIELGGSRFVFSEYALNKLFDVLKDIAKDPELLDEDSSYEGTTNAVNNATDGGNLRDILNVRNLDSYNLEAFAGIIDDAMEKTASILPLTDEYFIQVEKIAQQVATEVAEMEFEKTAADSSMVLRQIVSASDVFREFKALPWACIHDIDSKAVEILDSDQESDSFERKLAQIFRSHKSFLGQGGKDNNVQISSTTDLVLIDEDSNFKVLRKTNPVYKNFKVIDSKPVFRPDWVPVNKMLTKIGDKFDKLFMIKEGDNLYGPVKLRKVLISKEKDMGRSVFGEPEESNVHYVTNLSTLDDILFEMDVAVLPVDKAVNASADRWQTKVSVFLKDGIGVKALSPVEASSVLEENIKDSYALSLVYNRLTPSAFTLGRDTEILEVKESIITPVSDIDKLIFDADDQPLQKMAGASKVIIRKTVPDKDDYNISFDGGVGGQSKNIKNLTKADVIAVMRNAQISDDETIRMVAYLDAGNKMIEQYLDYNLDSFSGGSVLDRAKDLTAKMKANLFGNDAAKTVALSAARGAQQEVGQAAGARLLQQAGPTAFKAVDIFSKLANDSGALADRFEKIAMDQRSMDFRNIAGLMVVTHRFDNLIKEACEYEENLYDVSGLRPELIKLQPAIEKAAGELYDMMEDQKETGVEYLGHNTITQSLRTLDRLHAYSVSL